MDRPSVGRIVHYITDDSRCPVIAAIIAHVWDEVCVNLVLFDPGVTGVCESGTKTNVLRGDKPGCWKWPDRAKPLRSVST